MVCSKIPTLHYWLLMYSDRSLHLNKMLQDASNHITKMVCSSIQYRYPLHTLVRSKIPTLQHWLLMYSDRSLDLNKMLQDFSNHIRKVYGTIQYT